jgi:ATP-dependent DNA helicase DinG
VNPDATAADVAAVLKHVTAQLPGHEDRPGQMRMAELVAEAIQSEKHVVVQAGTGTGKSLAYLVPAILSGRHVVVATATKALQDQLATKDLPFLDQHLGQPFEWAILKGRSNYLCLQRLREATAKGDGQLQLDDLAPTVRAEIARLATWATSTGTGDQAELSWAPNPRAWEAVSVSAEQCPGAARCPLGEPCFAEAARRRAAEADVLVVNTHLYGMHVASGGVLLPEHDVVVFDEAHQLEDTISSTAGLRISAGRFSAVAASVRAIVDDDGLAGAIAGAGADLAAALAPLAGRRIALPMPDALVDALAAGRRHLDVAQEALRNIDPPLVDAQQRKLRAQRASTSLTNDLDKAMDVPPQHVAWVAGPDHQPALEVAPIDVGPLLDAAVWGVRTAVLTSATIPLGLPRRVGLDEDAVDVLDVGSPFDYDANALLYCAAHLPDPRHATFAAKVHDELEALVLAAGGRTLALFTSWRAMREAAEALRGRLPFRILTQDELPKPALVEAFSTDESSCLFATAGLFQGIDVPGASLSLVTIDRIPFPRPDDPLLEARRELAGSSAFQVVDLPRASTLLAQAAGRLIRNATDRGVVAVFDPRLAKAAYRWDVVRALPPMRRTKHRDEAERFLRDLRGA